jgi:diguanylate cyclase (GGDEF)-like protein/PAS domain S-box-containing protein
VELRVSIAELYAYTPLAVYVDTLPIPVYTGDSKQCDIRDWRVVDKPGLSKPRSQLLVACSSESPIVTSASGTLIRTIGPAAACGFLLCAFEGIKNELLPHAGTLTSHSAAIFFVTIAVALCAAPIALSIAGKNRSQVILRRSEERYRMLFEGNPVAMYVYARSSFRILAVNKAAIEQYGYTEQEFLAKTILEIRPEEDIPHLLQDVAAHTAGLQKRGTWRHRKKDGTILDVEIICHSIDFHGTDSILAAAYDVTERKRAEDSMRQAEEKYRGIFENAVVGIFQSAPDGRFLNINTALANMHGYDTPAELLESISLSGSKLLVDTAGMNKLAKAAEECGAVHGAELEICCKDGSRKWVRVNLRVLRDTVGKVVLREGTVEDITEHKAAQERMQFLAYYDALTELPHRAHLKDRLENAITGARRRGEKIALLFIDLDRFKNINDSFGHPFGDAVLKDVAKRLRGCAAESNMVARVGGDEFLMLLDNLKDPADAAIVASRLMVAMKPGFIVQGRSLSVGCSIGISIFPDHGEDGETLIRNADVAMYSSRANGRGNVRFFTDEMNAQVLERLNMDNNLQLALEQEEFFLVYQPQIDIERGRITGVEALLRWKHPGFGLIPPDRFIPIAEDNGLILPIGEWVLRTACRQAHRWQEEGLRAIPVAVNVSAVQFRQDNFLALIRRALQETGLAPEYLELEITESVLLSNEELTLSVLRGLKEMGVRLSIDDFGTGYSCLSYLRQYPIDKLKIDQSFIRDCVVNCDGAAITASIISMAHSLRLNVIAEGVETEAQMSFLRHHQCGEIQGYYFSRPVPADEAAVLLKREEGFGDIGEAAAAGKLFWPPSEDYSGLPLER